MQTYNAAVASVLINDCELMPSIEVFHEINNAMVSVVYEETKIISLNGKSKNDLSAKFTNLYKNPITYAVITKVINELKESNSENFKKILNSVKSNIKDYVIADETGAYTFNDVVIENILTNSVPDSDPVPETTKIHTSGGGMDLFNLGIPNFADETKDIDNIIANKTKDINPVTVTNPRSSKSTKSTEKYSVTTVSNRLGITVKTGTTVLPQTLAEVDEIDENTFIDNLNSRNISDSENSINILDNYAQAYINGVSKFKQTLAGKKAPFKNQTEENIQNFIRQWFECAKLLLKLEDSVRRDYNPVKLEIKKYLHSKDIDEPVLIITKEKKAENSKKAKNETIQYMREEFLTDANIEMLRTKVGEKFVHPVKAQSDPEMNTVIIHKMLTLFDGWIKSTEIFCKITIDLDDFFSSDVILNTINILSIEPNGEANKVSPIEVLIYKNTKGLLCGNLISSAANYKIVEESEDSIVHYLTLLIHLNKFKKPVTAATLEAIFKSRFGYVKDPEFKANFYRAVQQCDANITQMLDSDTIDPKIRSDLETWKSILNNKYFVEGIINKHCFTTAFNNAFKTLFTKESSMHFLVTCLYPISFLFTPFMAYPTFGKEEQASFEKEIEGVYENNANNATSLMSNIVFNYMKHIKSIDWLYYLKNTEGEHPLHIMSVFYDKFKLTESK